MCERAGSLGNLLPSKGITQMVAPQTWIALNRRALTAAYCLEDWTKELRAECLRQNIDPFDQDRDERTIAVKQSTVRWLISMMSEQSTELRRFSKRPNKGVRRSPPGFKP